VARLPFTNWERVQPVTRWLGEPGRSIRPSDAAARHRRLEALAREWWGDADYWITPTVPIPAPRVGAFAHLDAESLFRQLAPLGSFTAAFNLTGQPAVSIPVGLTSQGLPMGLQIGGRDFADGPVLALAKQLEEALAVPQTRPSAARIVAG